MTSLIISPHSEPENSILRSPHITATFAPAARGFHAQRYHGTNCITDIMEDDDMDASLDVDGGISKRAVCGSPGLQSHGAEHTLTISVRLLSDEEDSM
jgi:hypothetical protein